MPKIEYKCPYCGQLFSRMILKGDRPAGETCPRCHQRGVKPLTQSPRLFDGVCSFSTLSKDTN
jgi:DNA-directed RNA polymerase subunit RPC12/RpoP